jgi:hypothetical protein
MKTLIFLDVDGVMHPVATGSDFCCSATFIETIGNYDTSIIVTSDWRLGYSLEEVQALFKKYHIHVTDVTPDLRSLKPKNIREAEIELWRALNDPYSPFIVLDDNPKLFSSAYRKKHVFMTNSQIGFSDNNQQKMMAILETQSNKIEEHIRR